MELARLERVLEINNKYYTLLLEKQTEYQLSQAGITSYNEILKKAEIPSKPISPNRIIVYILCFIISLILITGLSFLKYLTHDKITSLYEIAKYSNGSIGILGMIPLIQTKIPISHLIIDKSPKSLLTESFRAIRTNLQFIANGKKI